MKYTLLLIDIIFKRCENKKIIIMHRILPSILNINHVNPVNMLIIFIRILIKISYLLRLPLLFASIRLCCVYIYVHCICRLYIHYTVKSLYTHSPIRIYTYIGYLLCIISQ